MIDRRINKVLNGIFFLYLSLALLLKSSELLNNINIVNSSYQSLLVSLVGHPSISNERSTMYSLSHLSNYIISKYLN